MGDHQKPTKGAVIISDQRALAARFQEMHRSPQPVILPNAWDAITARIFESAGFPAIGTTSAGMATALGYADGEDLPVEMLATCLSRMVASVQVPLSADIGSGYGGNTKAIIDNVRRLLDTGIAGINIEDSMGRSGTGLVPVDVQAERISAIRALADAQGIPLVINARTDTFRYRQHLGDALHDATIERAARYRQAGADCIFVFAVRDEAVIRQLVQAISAPVNIMATPGLPSIHELAALGVSRISIGPAALLAAMGVVKRIADELATHGALAGSEASPLSYAQLNAYFLGEAR